MIKDHSSDESGKLLRRKYWPEIEQILIAAKILDRLERPSSGVHATFVRMNDPLQFLVNAQSPKAQAIRKKIWEIPL
jgi:hypothetical protein